MILRPFVIRTPAMRKEEWPRRFCDALAVWCNGRMSGTKVLLETLKLVVLENLKAIVLQ